MAVTGEIRVEQVDDCLLCKNKGILLYKDLHDRILDTPGTWNLFRCPSCAFVWLNPRPVVEDMGKIYSDYHVNLSSMEAQTKGFFKNRIKQLLLKINFEAVNPSKNDSARGTKLARTAINLLPLGKVFSRKLISFLPYEKRGKLLDVGCGLGGFIGLMLDWGWEVTGIEPEEEAVKYLKEKKGIEVYLGSFEEIDFPEHSFDAVTMRHVLEHTPDPVLYLHKAWKILKPGGKLIIQTPNGESLGHRIFKKNYYSLDPPRHLYLFTLKTLSRCAQLAGIINPKIWALPSTTYLRYQRNQNIEATGKSKGVPSFPLFRKFTSLSLWSLELFLFYFRKNLGEELILEAEKM